MRFRHFFWGVMLIITGALFLVREFTGFSFGRYLVPVILIAVGGLFLLKGQFDRPSDRSSHH